MNRFTISIFLIFTILSASINLLSAQGSTCADPIVVSTLPFSQSAINTTNFPNTYSNVCGSTAMNGNDVIFSYTPSVNQYVKISLSNATSLSGDIGIFITTLCPDNPAVTCLSSAFGTSNPILNNLSLTAGTQYFIIILKDPGFLGLLPTFTFDIAIQELIMNDAAVSTITSPLSSCGLNQEQISATIINQGVDTISDLQIAYTINGGTPVVETYTTDILSGQSITYNFSQLANLSAVGNYTIKVYTILAGEGNTSNDTITSNVLNKMVISTPNYIEGFEANDGGWSASGTNSSWAWGEPVATAINAAATGINAWVTNLSGKHNPNENSYLVSPCFDFSAFNLPVIEFKIYYKTMLLAGVTLEYSKDGITWVKVGAQNDPNNWYNNINGWNGNSAQWITVKHSLDSLVGESKAMLRINFGAALVGTGNEDEGVGIDDIKVYDTQANDVGVTAILKPVSGCNLASETVSIQITNFGTAAQSNFIVAYSKDAGINWTNQPFINTLNYGETATFDFILPTDLSAITTYDFRAKTMLGGDQNNTNNEFSQMINHSTSLVVTIANPYIEDFDVNNGGWVAGGTNSSWALGEPEATIIDTAATAPNAWVTNLTGTHNTAENSYVESPCFDLSGLANPVVELSVWYENTTIVSGASLQYTTDGITWTALPAGSVSSNWYNMNGQWSGSSSAWLTARTLAPALLNQSGVRFRVAFTTSQFGPVTEGFAFDKFSISDCTAPEPVAGFTFVKNGNEVTFTNTSTDATSYQWNFGETIPATSTEQNPVHQFLIGGTYQVQLIVSNACYSDTITQTVDVTTGISNVNSSISAVYPNPNNGLFTILLGDKFVNQNAVVEIINLEGQCIYSKNISTVNTTSLNVKDIVKGIYLLRIKSEQQMVSHKLVVE